MQVSTQTKTVVTIELTAEQAVTLREILAQIPEAHTLLSTDSGVISQRLCLCAKRDAESYGSIVNFDNSLYRILTNKLNELGLEL